MASSAKLGAQQPVGNRTPFQLKAGVSACTCALPGAAWGYCRGAASPGTPKTPGYPQVVGRLCLRAGARRGGSGAALHHRRAEMGGGGGCCASWWQGTPAGWQSRLSMLQDGTESTPSARGLAWAAAAAAARACVCRLAAGGSQPAGKRAGFSLELAGETPFLVPLAGSGSVAGVSDGFPPAGAGSGVWAPLQLPEVPSDQAGVWHH